MNKETQKPVLNDTVEIIIDSPIDLRYRIKWDEEKGAVFQKLINGRVVEENKIK